MGELRVIIESSNGDEIPMMLFWKIGTRLRRALGDTRTIERQVALLDNVATHLTKEFGPRYSRSAIERMLRLGDTVSDAKEIAALAHDLTWHHVTHLIPMRNRMKRSFYATMCHAESWTPRELKEHIDDMLYEKTVMHRGASETAYRILGTVKDAHTPPDEMVYKTSDPLDQF